MQFIGECNYLNYRSGLIHLVYAHVIKEWWLVEYTVYWEIFAPCFIIAPFAVPGNIQDRVKLSASVEEWKLQGAKITQGENNLEYTNGVVGILG